MIFCKDRGHRTDWLLGMREREEARKMLHLWLAQFGGQRSHLWSGHWEGGEDEFRFKQRECQVPVGHSKG